MLRSTSNKDPILLTSPLNRIKMYGPFGELEVRLLNSEHNIVTPWALCGSLELFVDEGNPLERGVEM